MVLDGESILTTYGKVCLVTGASRGVGRGVAIELAEAGGKVYITGRTLDVNPNGVVSGSLVETAKEVVERGGNCIPVKCDHSNDEEVAKLFDKIRQDNDGQMDILVNNAFSGVKTMCEKIGTPFWELPSNIWEEMCDVGLRGHFICALHAAKLMVPRKQGLIVNISSPGGKVYAFNAVYGIGKVGTDRMAADCAKDLKPHNVAFVSLWPGTARTEFVEHFVATNQLDGLKEHFGLNSVELWDVATSVQYPGKAIVYLAQDPNLMDRTGQILSTTDLGKEFGFKDVDGKDAKEMF